MARRLAKPVKLGSRAKRLQRDLTGLVPMTSNREFRERYEEDAIEAKTATQADYIDAIESQKLTFGIGPAGTGKTFIATALAAERLAARAIDKLIITRPAVEAGEELGFLPGELDEKIAPYFAPVRQILERRLGKGQVEALIKGNRIEFMPLAYMRGHTLDRAFIILDEAQNTTPAQMKLFLTRLGEDSVTVVNGDLTQRDVKGPSGLADAFRRLRGLRGCSVVEFSRDDVVRSGLVADIVARYEHAEDEEDRAALDLFLEGSSRAKSAF